MCVPPSQVPMTDPNVQPTPLPPPGTIMRYVILHHTGIAQPHFDLMIQPPQARALLTWRIISPPGEWPAAQAERLADHRMVYMTYEGEISGGRGFVKRVGEGEVIVCEGKSFRLRLTGTINCEMDLPV